MTIDVLLDLVDRDIPGSRYKEIASLFLDSMENWPTCDQVEISSFIKELKGYFGTPLSIESISAKKFNGRNAWQLEAGSLLIEMIKLSDKYHNESDFDKITNGIFEHYKITFTDT